MASPLIKAAVYREGRMVAEHTLKPPWAAGKLREWLMREYGQGILTDADGISYMDEEMFQGGTFFFNCHSKQPELLYEPGERLNYFRAVYPRIKSKSPSSIAKAASSFILLQQQQGVPVFFNYRPDTAHALPLALVSPIFGTFIDKYSGRTPVNVSGRDCGFICELCEKSSASYVDEDSRCKVLIAILKAFFPEYVIEAVNNVDMAIYYKGFLLALIELKNEEGISGNSYLQGCRDFVQAAYDNVNEDSFLGTCFPKLLLEIAGPLMKIAGAVFTSAPAIEPLAMAFLIRKPDTHHMEKLCRMIASLRDALRDLAAFYDNAAPHRVALGIQDVWLPYPLQAMSSAGVTVGTKSSGESYVANLEGYRGEDETLTGLRNRGVREIFIKFCQRYGSAVHREWAARCCAPELFGTVELAGGWLMILMEYKRSFVDLEDVAELCHVSDEKWIKVSTLAQECLRRAQASELKGVHGDLRLPNLIVDEGFTQVLAVDFGWAGSEEDGDRYPYYMNHDHMQWPPGASEGSLMKQEHDRQLLQSQLSRMPTYSYDWKSDPVRSI